MNEITTPGAGSAEPSVQSHLSDAVASSSAQSPQFSGAGSAEPSVQSHLHPRASFAVADHPMPVGKEEIWRFSPLAKLHPLLDGAAATSALDWSGELPAGVTRSPLTRDDAIAHGVQAPFDRLAAIALEQAPAGSRLDVPAGTRVDAPIVLDARGRGGLTYGHTLVTIGDGARVTLVVRYSGAATYGEFVNVEIGAGADVNVVYVQSWGPGAIHGGQHSFLIGRDAHVRTVTASLGGDVVRLMETARFAGPGGQLEQFGLYFVDAGQHIEHRLFVDHNQPQTVSNIDYRGALQGKGARSVWVGDVLIRKNALGIDTYEANKNLMLTGGCHADSVPNLEIQTGQIKGAGHSSTTGRFDDEQLFYLCSRGIPEDEARRLVVHGFFADVIRRIGVPDVESALLAAVEAELATTNPSASSNQEN